MKSFYDELDKISPKWQNNDFIIDQIKKHFSEIDLLFNTNNEHRYKEVIDLVNILNRYLFINKSESELNELIDERFARFIEKSTPRKEWRIALTENCNYRCFFCHEEGLDMNKKQDKKSPHDIVQTIIEGHKLGYTDITLTGGEPFLEKKLIKNIIENLNSSNIYPDLTFVTNGYLVDEDILLFLKSYKGKIKFNLSLHSINESNYFKITNPKNNNDNSLKIVKDNIRKIKKYGFTLKLNIVLLKGINSSKEEIEEIVNFGIENNVDYIKFLELLVTDKLKEYFKYFLDVFSVEDILKSKLSSVKEDLRRKVFKYEETNLLIELQMCTCKIGCSKCLQVKDKVISADLKYYPCFILNTNSQNILNKDLKKMFYYGDKELIKMAKKFGDDSPFLVKPPRYVKSKKDFFFTINSFQLKDFTKSLLNNGFCLNQKSSSIEKYFTPIDNTENEWKEFKKILKLTSKTFRPDIWFEVIQTLNYQYEANYFCSNLTFFYEYKPKEIYDIENHIQYLGFLNYKENLELRWELEEYKKGDKKILIGLETNSGINVISLKNINNDIIDIINEYKLENIKMPLIKYFLTLTQQIH